ncbi:cardiolipin synthase B [Bordetella genomosp. 1]|uniref:Cardiolipin synthase B n=1 Tax=Bordetella genomosp. 1 TaxID=1395607 RepID=A0A261S625_9BORD|nr:phospholipase D-like domain-containing protein [Bordetella genomosp. 1]OZI32786.1 cardiolipin synthase B [Bordetella genomosp. 1]
MSNRPVAAPSGGRKRAGALRQLARVCVWAVVALAAGCASVPGPEALRERRAQAGLSADSGWDSYERGRDIAAGIGKKPGEKADEASFMARHVAVEEAISGAPLVQGNAVRLLADGPATYKAMLGAIAQAQRYVHMETYIFDDDEQGRRFADALIAARQRGASVAVMVDAVGTLSTSDALFKRMRDAGVQVVVFNPVNPLAARAGWSINQRNHRKLLVVDGQVGFLGGINVSSVYSSSSRSGSKGGSGSGLGSGPADGPHPDAAQMPWRDTHIEVRGPAVAEIEKVILEGWESQKGPPLEGDRFMRVVKREGNLSVRILANDPNDSEDGYAVYLTLMSAFESAQKSIHITMAYFVPDPAFIEALAQAARRGVEVILILPGFSDSGLVFHAGRSHYEDLLTAGVQIYERRDALLHAKTAVVDGVWSTVGSSNMDWRSFALNFELNAVILGPEFGAQMEALFREDVAASVRIDGEAWRDRPVDDRFMEFFGRMFERWL